jgi:hypothetical protein
VLLGIGGVANEALRDSGLGLVVDVRGASKAERSPIPIRDLVA